MAGWNRWCGARLPFYVFHLASVAAPLARKGEARSATLHPRVTAMDAVLAELRRHAGRSDVDELHGHHRPAICRAHLGTGAIATLGYAKPNSVVANWGLRGVGDRTGHVARFFLFPKLRHKAGNKCIVVAPIGCGSCLRWGWPPLIIGWLHGRPGG